MAEAPKRFWWVGDLVGFVLLFGPFLAGPAVVVFSEHEAPLLFGWLSFVSIVALFAAAWRRRATVTLLVVPLVAIAAALIAGRRWPKTYSMENSKGLSEVANRLATLFHHAQDFWVAGLALATTALALTGIVLGLSSRENATIRTNGRRIAALLIVLFGCGAIAGLEATKLHFQDVERTWACGGVAFVGALGIHFAAGAAHDDDDDEGRARAVLAWLYAMGAVACAALGVSFTAIAIDHFDVTWDAVAASARLQSPLAARMFRSGILFEIPIVIAGLLTVRPRGIFRARSLRLPNATLLITMALAFVLWITVKLRLDEVAVIDFPLPAGVTLPAATTFEDQCHVEPDDIIVIGKDRISRNGIDFGPAAQLDDPKSCADFTVKLKPIGGLAVDRETKAGRLRCLAKDVGCDGRLIVRETDGHARCLKARMSDCSSPSDTLEVAMSVSGPYQVAWSQHHALASTPKSVLAKDLPKVARDQAATKQGTLEAVILTPDACIMSEVVTALDGLNGILQPDSEAHAYKFISIAPLVPRKLDLADAEIEKTYASVVGDARLNKLLEARTACTQKLCSFAYGTKLNVQIAQAYLDAKRMDDAVEFLFIAQGGDEHALDKLTLDPKTLAALKKRKQPKVDIVGAGDIPTSIQAVVNGDSGALRRCVSELSLRRPIEPGKWMSEVTIDAAGLVTNTETEGMGHGTALGCVSRAFRAMPFPALPAITTVRYQITLAPAPAR